MQHRCLGECLPRGRGTASATQAPPSLAGPTAFGQILAALRAHDWVVYAKPPFAGPEQALEYLGRYAHRVALSNDRLVSMDERRVRLRWKDYAGGNRGKTMASPAEEFLHRFLRHVLPDGFVRIRHFGLLANRAPRRSWRGVGRCSLPSRRRAPRKSGSIPRDRLHPNRAWPAVGTRAMLRRPFIEREGGI